MVMGGCSRGGVTGGAHNEDRGENAKNEEEEDHSEDRGLSAWTLCSVTVLWPLVLPLLCP